MLDLFSTKDFFSRKRFGENKKKKKQFKLPDSLTQVEVKVNGYQPSHGEFWLFGFTPFFIYRSSFPLYPLPLAIFSPLIMHHLTTCSKKKTDVKVHMRTVKNELFFHYASQKKSSQKKKKRKHHKKSPFLLKSFQGFAQFSHQLTQWYLDKKLSYPSATAA